MATKKIQFCQEEAATMPPHPQLESAIQNVICAADLASGPIEAAISGETACYAFYKLLEEIDALRRAADAQYAADTHYAAAHRVAVARH